MAVATSHMAWDCNGVQLREGDRVRNVNKQVDMYTVAEILGGGFIAVYGGSARIHASQVELVSRSI